LRAFSIDIGDNPSRGDLLNRIRGASVTVTAGSEKNVQKHSGIVMGVESHTTMLPDRQGVTRTDKLNLLTEDGLACLPLEVITQITIEDKKLEAELRQALAIVSQGRDASKRPLTLTFSGKGERNVLIGYLTEAPAWQTAYRLVLAEKPVLQGWALVQNTSQDDWADVQLNLVAGRPISFIQDLYSPLYVHRPVVKSQIPASPTPQAYLAELEDQETLGDHPHLGPVPAAAPATLGSRRARTDSLMGSLGGGLLGLAGAGDDEDAMATAEMAARQSVATAGAQLGQSHFVYNIQVPVSVPRQQSAMIPFLSEEIEAERVSVYNLTICSDHPLAGARLKNATELHLMGGPLTVFSEQSGSEKGYVGDALIDDTEPGQSRLISFAIDLAVDTTLDKKSKADEFVSFKIVNGVLKFERRLVQESLYTFKNHGGEQRTIIVEHPYRGEDWTVKEPSGAMERTPDSWRFEIKVPAGRTEKLVVVEQMMQQQALGLQSVGQTHAFNVLHKGKASKALLDAIADLESRQRALTELSVRITDIEGKLELISKGQERIRKNMGQLDHGSDLYKRYIDVLDSQETQIPELEKQKAALQEQLNLGTEALNEYVSHLNLE
ncbi:MAG TPA: hypothetical protein VFW40_12820, partial [Capsulimonadaceae bacterium]|nr:hypothetical protein [Capsulimonadaceae bacterium]